LENSVEKCFSIHGQQNLQGRRRKIRKRSRNRQKQWSMVKIKPLSGEKFLGVNVDPRLYFLGTNGESSLK
jgi:hypothetical protein